MARWTAFPHDADAYTYDMAALKNGMIPPPVVVPVP